MIAYVVAVSYKKFAGLTKVSQEAYKTLEAAQDFCMSRTGAKKLNNFAFDSEECLYSIFTVSVKE